MQSPYERLVEKLGEKGAKAEMKRRRKMVKNPGFASMSKEKIKEISDLGHAAKRAEKAQDEE